MLECGYITAARVGEFGLYPGNDGVLQLFLREGGPCFELGFGKTTVCQLIRMPEVPILAWSHDSGLGNDLGPNHTGSMNGESFQMKW